MIYLGLAGLAFFAAAGIAQPTQMGRFAIASAYASLVMVAIEFGVGRRLLVEIGTTQIRQPVLRRLAKLRAPLWLTLLAAAVTFATWNPIVTAATFVIMSRLLVSDGESILLGIGRSAYVSTATLANGLATLVATLVAAAHGAVALVLASGIGNVLASAILWVAVSRAPRTMTEDPDAGFLAWSAVWPFGLMAVVGVVYLRAGIAILHPLGITAEQVASYAIAFKVIEMATALRGAIVQRAVVQLTDDFDPSRISETLRRLSLLTIPLSIAGVAFSLLAERLSLLNGYPLLWQLVGISSVLMPVVFSHTETSAWIFAQRGRAEFLLDSIGLALSAVAILALCATIDVRLVIGATCVMEYISYVIFSRRYGEEWRKVRRRGISWPVSYCLPALFIFAMGSEVVR